MELVYFPSWHFFSSSALNTPNDIGRPRRLRRPEPWSRKAMQVGDWWGLYSSWIVFFMFVVFVFFLCLVRRRSAAAAAATIKAVDVLLEISIHLTIVSCTKEALHCSTELKYRQSTCSTSWWVSLSLWLFKRCFFSRRKVFMAKTYGLFHFL